MKIIMINLLSLGIYLLYSQAVVGGRCKGGAQIQHTALALKKEKRNVLQDFLFFLYETFTIKGKTGNEKQN